MSLTYHDPATYPAQPPAPAKPAPLPLPPGLAATLSPLLPCKRCNGDGYTFHRGFDVDESSLDGKPKSFPSRWDVCNCCDGAGWFHAPDLKHLIKQIIGRKPRTLRSARPKSPRAYYLWRLARFHGGKDICLPMGAEMEISGDPYRDTLDAAARFVAQAYFGSGNVGTARWHQAMYGKHEFSDLPDVLDGPVYDSDKPISEMMETF